MAAALKEPAIRCMLALFVLALLHLVVELPSYGIWAVRDATMCLDGIFMLLGLFWALKPNSYGFVTKWLMVVFVLNMFYSFTQPWGEKLSGHDLPKAEFFLAYRFWEITTAGRTPLVGSPVLHLRRRLCDPRQHAG